MDIEISMKIKNYINGEYVNPISNNWIENYNPSIGEVYGQLQNFHLDSINRTMFPCPFHGKEDKGGVLRSRIHKKQREVALQNFNEGKARRQRHLLKAI